LHIHTVRTDTGVRPSHPLVRGFRSRACKVKTFCADTFLTQQLFEALLEAHTWHLPKLAKAHHRDLVGVEA
jgi:hypothetical protein